MKRIRHAVMRSLLVLALLGCSGNVYAGDYTASPPPNVSRSIENKESIKAYLLPADHPLQENLKGLFTSPKMFATGTNLKKAGFKVMRGHKELMVGSHSAIKGYLIKKFPNFHPQSEQLSNFIKRIKGARTIQKYIKDHNFQHLVVPQKWLYELPSNFSSKSDPKQYVLIVEKMDVIPGGDHGEQRRRYTNMDKEVLTQYGTLLHDLDGCDAWPRNQPFTTSGQIAFLDTEHLGMKKGDFLGHILQFLNRDLRKFAIDLWDNLEAEKERAHNAQMPIRH